MPQTLCKSAVRAIGEPQSGYRYSDGVSMALSPTESEVTGRPVHETTYELRSTLAPSVLPHQSVHLTHPMGQNGPFGTVFLEGFISTVCDSITPTAVHVLPT